MYELLEEENHALRRWIDIWSNSYHRSVIIIFMVLNLVYTCFLEIFYPYNTYFIIRELNNNYGWNLLQLTSICLIICGNLWTIILGLIYRMYDRSNYQKNMMLEICERIAFVILFVQLFATIYTLIDINNLAEKGGQWLISDQEHRLIVSLLYYMRFLSGMFFITLLAALVLVLYILFLLIALCL